MCVFWVLVLTPVARRIGLVDYPNERKLHEGIVPLIGGIAIYLAMLPTLFGYWVDPLKLPLLLAVTVLVIMGGADDRFHLSARLRLAIQIVVIALISEFGTNIHYLGALFGGAPIELQGAFVLIFTEIVVLGIINAVNMADGMDGLAGGLVLVAVAGLIALHFWYGGAGTSSKLPILFALAGALIGFTMFNFRHGWRAHAAIFLGDAGSMFLGMMLVILMIRLSQTGEPGQFRPITMIWLVAIPVLDLWMVLIRRMQQRRALFSADNNHIHYLLLKRGLSPEAVVNRQLTISAIFASVGVLSEVYLFPEWLMLLSFFAILGWLLWHFRHD